MWPTSLVFESNAVDCPLHGPQWSTLSSAWLAANTEIILYPPQLFPLQDAAIEENRVLVTVSHVRAVQARRGCPPCSVRRAECVDCPVPSTSAPPRWWTQRQHKQQRLRKPWRGRESVLFVCLFVCSVVSSKFFFQLFFLLFFFLLFFFLLQAPCILSDIRTLTCHCSASDTIR